MKLEDYDPNDDPIAQGLQPSRLEQHEDYSDENVVVSFERLDGPHFCYNWDGETITDLCVISDNNFWMGDLTPGEPTPGELTLYTMLIQEFFAPKDFPEFY